MRDFSYLPAPQFIQPLPGHLEMVLWGDMSDYLCPDCGQQLCWLDYISTWSCRNCDTTQEDET
ncbi:MULTISPECIES: hypothetical protein [unclassified Tolypothrix]|uniref:hypothetical protein n=1 Tax=unclassified Tolypothrix TaxID=2649714 RepID=UPI0005EAB9FE|nr:MULTISPECIES: hypothetical protein [unclassified Tolypothrix]BAY89645.1 hypothetical protein NIES3275_16480 [Microchaete diplosiphon NIES-3275]EKE97659.1 hypothetical protein FDUTEX481_05037 [Tolypothrix sp. PCC 7601]MBE9083235.1 hypothetical protein [Tolypothrix sp. LEGE 11397]UYD23915.1 hypothetical protein HGR01_20660 [Tolypothrix sp. PCC 7712]UYD33860.1 hypothetical protein HG267_34095 [Tolypothrix sp. PCC 7601]